MSSSSVPFTAVLGAPVNTDPIVVSNDEINVMEAPLANELNGSVVDLQAVEFSHYRYDEVLMSMELITGLTFMLRGIQCSRVKVWLRRFVQLRSTTTIG